MRNNKGTASPRKVRNCLYQKTQNSQVKYFPKNILASGMTYIIRTWKFFIKRLKDVRNSNLGSPRHAVDKNNFIATFLHTYLTRVIGHSCLCGKFEAIAFKRGKAHVLINPGRVQQSAADCRRQTLNLDEPFYS